MNTETLSNQICPNCQASLQGQFCYACGQNQKSINRHFTNLVTEFFEDVVSPNSRSARTLFAVCFQPGFLTQEYFSGRRARYIQPVRLYLTTSILFFFFASLFTAAPMMGIDNNESAIIITEEEPVSVDIDWSFLSTGDSESLNANLNAQVEKALLLFQEDPARVRDMIIDGAPPVLFCLVPLFALLLKLTYLNKGRYYTEHLVLALHNHSFLFVMLFISALIELVPSKSAQDWLELPLDIWIPTYLFLSLKTTYQDGWLATSLKFLFLGSAYWILFLSAAAIATVISVLNL